MSDLQVKIKKGQNIAVALKRLKKKMLKEGIFEELRERRYYVKPSQIKQKKKKEQNFKNYLRNKNNKY